MAPAAPWSAVPPRYRIAAGLGISQAVAFMLWTPVYYSLGWTVEWAGGPRLLPLAAVGVAVWAFTRRRTITGAGLAYALLMSGSIVSILWQYAGVALNRPLIDASLACADAVLGISVKELTA